MARSSLIRLYSTKTLRISGIDLDAALNAEQRGTAWALEKPLENHLDFLAKRCFRLEILYENCPSLMAHAKRVNEVFGRGIEIPR